MRRATRADIPAMVAVLRRHHAGQRFPFVADTVQAATDIAAAIDDPDSLCLVADRCVLIAKSYRPMLTPIRVAVEIMLRCEQPGMRDRFVVEFERWAAEKGCAVATLSTTHSVPAFTRLYRRAGYLPAETTFAKTL